MAGDFNGDNHLDLAVAGASNQVAILMGNGDGTFKPPVQYATGAFSSDCGKLSRAISTPITDWTSRLSTPPATTYQFYWGNGDGTFQSHVDYPAGDGPYGLAVADFNGDGKQDLAVATYYDNSISVLLGKGNGTFEAKKSYGAGVNPWGLAAADLNGDGKSEFSPAANSGSNTVTLLVNEGKGTFQGHSDISLGTGSIPFTVVIADLGADRHSRSGGQ